MKKHIKSPVPIYVLGATFFIYSLIFSMRNFWHLIMALMVSFIVYLIFKLFFKGHYIETVKEFEKTGDSDADRMIAEGKAFMLQISDLKSQVEDEQVKKSIDDILATSTDIFDFASKNPEKTRYLHASLDYYFPTTIKFLENYVHMQDKGTGVDNIASSLEKISTTLPRLERLFKNQLNSLYKDAALDIKTDIVVIENIIKQAGL